MAHVNNYPVLKMSSYWKKSGSTVLKSHAFKDDIFVQGQALATFSQCSLGACNLAVAADQKFLPCERDPAEAFILTKDS